jgi:glycosyltransferase involved in cell wall biosynthesis
MPTFYSAIDCFILVSRFEPFGYVYIEAMGCKRPVIACNAAGPAEIVVSGETGLFAEMSNPIHLAERMKTYLENRELLERHGNAARQRVINEFSSTIMARRTQDLYLETYEMARTGRNGETSAVRQR